MKEQQPQEVYWGIGIENETYLQFEETITVNGAFIQDKIGCERYSIDYRKCYKSGLLSNVVEATFDREKEYQVSKMVNSHSLDKLDINYQHKTLPYTKPAVDNPEFTGKTILELFLDTQPYYIQRLITQKNNPMGAINFDGDSIEFVTKYFENRTIPVACNELKATKKLFLDKLNESKVLNGILRFPSYNIGLNMFISNQENLVLFNNGTFHFHITLPTHTENSRVIDYPAFEAKHANAIYLLQWFEPLFIATLGSPDIMAVASNLYDLPEKFAGGSMRNAMSRYTGVGTFHKSMAKGKILTYAVDEFRKLLRFEKEDKIWWRDQIESDLGYELLSDIGLDFNQEKMYQSGFEFRSFDEFPIEYLNDVLHAIVLVCEHALTNADIPWCHDSIVWNNIVYKALKFGHLATLTIDEKQELLKVLNINSNQSQQAIEALASIEKLDEFFFGVLEVLHDKYKNNNECVDALCGQQMTKPPHWDNFNKYQVVQHLKQLKAL